ncbi:MAG: hypothetical protein IJI04_07150, partial [Lachnospiraceae bacterium]|nr:hypothetical protein [Lachnospiraceae bacterium]
MIHKTQSSVLSAPSGASFFASASVIIPSSLDIADWRTQTYPVENLEELMITNTLREKNLDIEK